SYSKTDHDATFMRMKDDYMKNGQLKAGYNVQIATEGQYTLAYGVFPNPTDTRTFIPFLKNIEERYFKLPKYIVADAGYGSEQNYSEVLHRNRTPLITYNSYRMEKKKKYKENPFFLKANLRFTRMSVRGKSKVENELGFAFMAVNLRKYTAFRQNTSLNYNKKDSSYHFLITGIFFNFIRASYVPAPCLLDHHSGCPLPFPWGLSFS
ncbi:transposase, partial [Agaribacter marinus]